MHVRAPTASSSRISKLSDRVCLRSVLGIDEQVLITRRVPVANLRSRSLGITDSLFRVFFNHVSRLFHQLAVRARGLILRGVLPELRSRRNLRAFRDIQSMAEHVSAAAVRVLNQGDKPLTAKLGSALRLAAVLELEQPADDLLFASFLHASNSEPDLRKMKPTPSRTPFSTGLLAPRIRSYIVSRRTACRTLRPKRPRLTDCASSCPCPMPASDSRTESPRARQSCPARQTSCARFPCRQTPSSSNPLLQPRRPGPSTEWRGCSQRRRTDSSSHTPR